MEKLYEYLPKELINFLLVTIFSFLIGITQRKINLKKEHTPTLFGTDRTFTLIGILGYLLYILTPQSYTLFIYGGITISGLLVVNYYVKQIKYDIFGATTIVIALITYCLGPIIETQPSWFYVLVVVMVLLLSESKDTFTEWAQRMNNDEIVTLAKFLAISGIILPMLPNKDIFPGIHLSAYTIWLATVVVSGISYLSYLLRQYVFKRSGIILSGIIGGLYSSTATISVLARQSAEAPKEEAPDYVAGMLMAISMMFLRFLILIGIFSSETLRMIYPYMIAMSIVAATTGWIIHKKRIYLSSESSEIEAKAASNPLEFKVAIIFAILFVVFTLLTHYTLTYAGTDGLNILSFASGLSDITPFILNLLHGTDSLSVSIIATCAFQAIISNIAMNMGYAFFFSGGRKSKLKKWIMIGFSIVLIANLIVIALT